MKGGHVPVLTCISEYCIRRTQETCHWTGRSEKRRNSSQDPEVSEINSPTRTQTSSRDPLACIFPQERVLSITISRSRAATCRPLVCWHVLTIEQ